MSTIEIKAEEVIFFTLSFHCETPFGFSWEAQVIAKAEGAFGAGCRVGGGERLSSFPLRLD